MNTDDWWIWGWRERRRRRLHRTRDCERNLKHVKNPVLGATYTCDECDQVWEYVEEQWVDYYDSGTWKVWRRVERPA